jgi:hypothetical protein
LRALYSVTFIVLIDYQNFKESQIKMKSTLPSGYIIIQL